MTRTRFHQELEELKHRILAMAGMAEQAVDLAVQAYSQRDIAMCQRVLNNESAINRAEREVDEFAVDLLAMQQQSQASASGGTDLTSLSIKASGLVV